MVEEINRAKREVYDSLRSLRDSIEHLRRLEDRAGLKKEKWPKPKPLKNEARVTITSRCETELPNGDFKTVFHLVLNPNNYHALGSQIARILHWMKRDGVSEK